MSRLSAESRSRRLERRLLTDRAWQQFVERGIESKGIRQEILCSWRRSRDSYRIDPAAKRPSTIASPEVLEERRARDEWFRLAMPVLRDFTKRFRLFDHVITYFDGEGWMLSLQGDRRIADRLAEISFCPGTNWAEPSAGTNGPGTALVTGKPVEVFASEHYVAAWQAWSCAAAPIKVPGSAAPIGLVDMTGPWEVRRRQALTFVSAIACAIEERLRAAWSVRDEVVRYAFRTARGTGDTLVAVDCYGRIVSANDAATRSGILDEGGSLQPVVRDAVIKILRSPCSRAESDARLDSAEGPPLVVSTVRHEGSRVGAIVRVCAAGSGPRRPGTPTRPTARYDFDRILGQSESLRRAVEFAKTASRNNLPVVLSGESGTGKELFAQAIHSASDRQTGPFVAVNCGSIPAPLLEAELFGYEPGTFTDARREGNPGRFEDADGGTLFLDEVSELSLPAQTALLRVLQEQEVVRLGGSVPLPVNVRIVAATNKPLEGEVLSKGFRSDLYYRLNVLPILVPSLRERGDDVALLARAFLADTDVERRGLTLTDGAIDALRAHPWPGNVRELKNVILRAAAVAPRPRITEQDLLLDPAPPDSPVGAFRRTRRKLRSSLAEPDRGALVAVLDSCTWNFKRTAHELGISRMTLYRWVRKHGISRTSR